MSPKATLVASVLAQLGHKVPDEASLRLLLDKALEDFKKANSINPQVKGMKLAYAPDSAQASAP